MKPSAKRKRWKLHRKLPPFRNEKLAQHAAVFERPATMPRARVAETRRKQNLAVRLVKLELEVSAGIGLAAAYRIASHGDATIRAMTKGSGARDG